MSFATQRRGVLLVTLIATGSCFVGVALGMYTARFRTFPYEHVAAIYRKLSADSGEEVVSQLRSLHAGIRKRTIVGDGTLVGYGGGIAVVGDLVIGADAAGQFFYYDGEAILPLAISLDSNRPAALEFFEENMTPDSREAGLKNFRILDVEVRPLNRGLEIYVTHFYWVVETKAKSWRLSRLTIRESSEFPVKAGAYAQDDWEVVYECSPRIEFAAVRDRPFTTNHNGGRMVFGADDRLYVSAGDQRFDGISDPFIASQAPDTCFGKILRFDPDSGTIEEIARGLRNSQGLTFDSSGKLWATEHGPRGGDELNLIESGGNYGWPYNTFGTSYDVRRNWTLAVEPGRHRQFRRPVFAWLPSVGPSAILQVAGTPAVWSGDLLMGSLAGAALHRLRIADGNVVFEERIPLGERVRDLVQLADGRFIVWTDGPSLLDLQVVDKSDDLKMPVPLTAEQKSLAVGDALAQCAGCHALGRSESSQYAPSLWQVYGRAIASTDFPGYSASLKKRQGVWDHVTLYNYLADPNSFSPGTTMSRVPEMSGQTRTALIDYLQSLQ